LGALLYEDGRRGSRHSARLRGLRGKAERVVLRPRPLVSKWGGMERVASRPRPLVGKWGEMKGVASRPRPLVSKWGEMKRVTSRPHPLVSKWREIKRVASRPHPLVSKWGEMKRVASRPRPLVGKWGDMKGPPLRAILLCSPFRGDRRDNPRRRGGGRLQEKELARGLSFFCGRKLFVSKPPLGSRGGR
jgi:hypothetical protein